MSKIIRLGSRQSPLALRQTEYVGELLQKSHPRLKLEIIPMRTKGDKLLDVPLAKIGDKGLFTRELEEALLENRIDLAVHSMKDLPTQLPKGLCIGAMTARLDPRDALLAKEGLTFRELPPGSLVGTSSLRRKAQLLHIRPDLRLVDLRGNVGTRIRRLEEGEFTAIVLAVAGVERLALQEKITQRLDYSICLPAVGQGALGVEAREDDGEILELLQAINHQETEAAILAERSLLRTLEGGCQIPLGAIAEVKGSGLRLQGMVADLTGSRICRDEVFGLAKESGKLGEELAKLLLLQGAGAVLSELRKGDSHE